MPYKDPEHKRQWEREHREERNARQRNAASGQAKHPYCSKTSARPNSDKTNGKRLEDNSWLSGRARRRSAFGTSGYE